MSRPDFDANRPVVITKKPGVADGRAFGRWRCSYFMPDSDRRNLGIIKDEPICSMERSSSMPHLCTSHADMVAEMKLSPDLGVSISDPVSLRGFNQLRGMERL